MIEAVVDFRSTATVSATAEEAWSLVSNVPDSAAHFPDVVSITEQSGLYTWVLKALGARKISVQTSYGCRYTLDEGQRIVTWTADHSVGNARVSGTWRVTDSGAGAQLALVNRFALDVPVPRMLAGAARPIVSREAERLLQGYFANIVSTLNGGDGRQR